jgi:hypothetical protein
LIEENAIVIQLLNKAQMLGTFKTVSLTCFVPDHIIILYFEGKKKKKKKKKVEAAI